MEEEVSASGLGEPKPIAATGSSTASGGGGSEGTPGGGNTPPPGGNTPPPGANTPPPGGNTPPPGANTPPPGGNSPPPGGTMMLPSIEIGTPSSTGRPQLSPSHPKADKTPVGRTINPPKLERKHSSGDLHSRLKTRKMLGVGETDNGDIHRSKISQMLGHNDHLYLKLPRGYWNWQAFLAGLLAFQAVFIVIFPQKSSQLGLVGVAPSADPVPSQYYAVSILALSFLLWKFLNLKDKGVVRTVLVTVIIHFSSLCLVDIVHALLHGISFLWDVKGLTMMGLRGGTLFISIFYLSRMGTATSGLRKSPSYKDVTDNNVASGSSRRE